MVLSGVRSPVKAGSKWTLPVLLEEAGNGPMLVMLVMLCKCRVADVSLEFNSVCGDTLGCLYLGMHSMLGAALQPLASGKRDSLLLSSCLLFELVTFFVEHVKHAL